MRVLALLLFIAVPAFGAPFINSDPEATLTADQCICQEGSATPIAAATSVAGKCRVDVSAITAGSHDFQCWFNSSLWTQPGAKGSITVKKPSAFPAPVLNLGL